MTAEEAMKIRHTYSDDYEFDVKELQKAIDEALEKQMPKKVIWKSQINWSGITGYYCPNCSAPILDDWSFYCKTCGQHFDWSEKK